MTRRDWLRLAGLSGLSALAAGATRGSESGTAPPGFGRAKSVILLFTGGGVSQIDTFDPKPDAPEEVRGEFRTIQTATPGLRFTEHLPLLARLSNRYAVIRSITHDDVDHGSASYLALTGQFHPRKSSNPRPTPNDFPTHGALFQRMRPSMRFPYSAVHVNGPVLAPREPSAGQFGGFLGRAHEPLVLGDITEGGRGLPELAPQPDLPRVRLAARQSLLDAIDRQLISWQRDGSPRNRDVLYQQAYAFLDSPRYRRVFDLSQEPDRVRERYGPNRSGQACLLARRLVEAGVPWITVLWNHMIRGQDMTPTPEDEFGWDTHNNIFPTLKDHLLPRFDRSLSALLEDLAERGLLDETLVVCMGEFGRAPTVALEPGFAGDIPGRKHWAGAYSVLVAGAGVVGGAVIGATNAQAGYPRTPPFTPCDLAATMFAALGIDPSSHYHDLSARPYLVSAGIPIRELYRQ